MVHFGTNTEDLHDEIVPTVKCMFCNQAGGVRFTVLGKYFYLIVLPVFPIKKTVLVECELCHKELEEPAFNSEYQMIAADLKRETKYPLWFYLFWVIAGAILVYNVWKKGGMHF